jgi:hypothetical protein
MSEKPLTVWELDMIRLREIEEEAIKKEEEEKRKREEWEQKVRENAIKAEKREAAYGSCRTNQNFRVESHAETCSCLSFHGTYVYDEKNMDDETHYHLELRPDNHFTLVDARYGDDGRSDACFFGGTVTSEGTYIVDGDKINFSPTSGVSKGWGPYACNDNYPQTPNPFTCSISGPGMLKAPSYDIAIESCDCGFFAKFN